MLCNVLYIAAIAGMVVVAVSISAARIRLLQLLEECEELGFVTASSRKRRNRVVRDRILIYSASGMPVDLEKENRDGIAAIIEKRLTTIGIGLTAATECKALLEALQTLAPLGCGESTGFRSYTLPAATHIRRKIARMWMRAIKRVSKRAERFLWENRGEEVARCTRTANRKRYLRRRWRAMRKEALRELDDLLRGPAYPVVFDGKKTTKRSASYRSTNSGQTFIPTYGLRAKLACYIPTRRGDEEIARKDVDEAVRAARSFDSVRVEKVQSRKHSTSGLDGGVDEGVRAGGGGAHGVPIIDNSDETRLRDGVGVGVRICDGERSHAYAYGDDGEDQAGERPRVVTVEGNKVDIDVNGCEVVEKRKEIIEKGQRAPNTTAVADLLLEVLDGFAFIEDPKVARADDDVVKIRKEGAKEVGTSSDAKTGQIVAIGDEISDARSKPVKDVVGIDDSLKDAQKDETEVKIKLGNDSIVQRIQQQLQIDQKEVNSGKDATENANSTIDLNPKPVQNPEPTNNNHDDISPTAGPINIDVRKGGMAGPAVPEDVDSAAPPTQQTVDNVGPVDTSKGSDRNGKGEMAEPANFGLGSLAASSASAIDFDIRGAASRDTSLHSSAIINVESLVNLASSTSLPLENIKMTD
ncbi:hypothetical protein HDU97_009427, partial [Phlyctochytrium planicorne]